MRRSCSNRSCSAVKWSEAYTTSSRYALDPLSPAGTDKCNSCKFCGVASPSLLLSPPLVLPLQVLVDDEKEKGCVHLKVLQEPEAKKLIFAFVGLQKDKNMDETIENFQ